MMSELYYSLNVRQTIIMKENHVKMQMFNQPRRYKTKILKETEFKIGFESEK